MNRAVEHISQQSCPQKQPKRNSADKHGSAGQTNRLGMTKKRSRLYVMLFMPKAAEQRKKASVASS